MDRAIKTRFGALHAHVQGQGPAILLIHGYHPDNDGHVWENTPQAFHRIVLDFLAGS